MRALHQRTVIVWVGAIVQYAVSTHAGVVIVSVVLAVTRGAVALLWTPEPAPSASKQLGDVTGAISPAPMPAGDQLRPDIGTWREFPAVPVVAQAEPRSDCEPAPHQLQAGPSPVPKSRQALNVPPAAAIATPSSEPAAQSGNAPELLPENAPVHVLVSYAPQSAAARQEAAGVVRLLRGGGLAASDPAPAAPVAGKAGITYFFAEDAMAPGASSTTSARRSWPRGCRRRHPAKPSPAPGQSRFWCRQGDIRDWSPVSKRPLRAKLSQQRCRQHRIEPNDMLRRCVELDSVCIALIPESGLCKSGSS
ncbi:MAG: hypothetical protein ACR2KT_06090 [Methylocella sp.]